MLRSDFFGQLRVVHALECIGIGQQLPSCTVVPHM